MIQIENFSYESLMNCIMNVSDIIMRHAVKSGKEQGLYLDKTWITPEGCYHLYRLLSLDESGALADKKALELLKNGTNHPELL